MSVPPSFPPSSSAPSSSPSSSSSFVFPSVVRPPGADAPATCEVPQFAPVRVRGGRYRLRRLVRSRRRALALGLAVTAAALVAAGPGSPGRESGSGASPGSGDVDRARGRPAVETVAAPVRIADAATVRLLRPGDRVDVIAAEERATGGHAHVVARKALVTKVPGPLPEEEAAGVVDGGALVVLSVPRPTAARLAGASATARLAVTLW
ncbi:hypothetical protein [Streptomyces sp. A012304]|uniref:hypothetical protein n=1 Tax=Streptomyces sp. A012304 TaxID=375446 RepID=UPI00222F6B79|nr:hypothetical protein [Streptomyces sp. A012304]